MKSHASESDPFPDTRTWWVHRVVDMELTQLWVKGIKVVLSLLILTILCALAGGVMKTFLDVKLLLAHPLEEALRHIIVDTLILLAVVEVFKTTLTYFSEGRVKVTFIVDTILVVMLTEVISQWFKGGEVSQLAVLGAILLTLAAMRVMAVRFSPAQEAIVPEVHEISDR
jgi:uncharacterized membrane protein (DUF373 family)